MPARRILPSDYILKRWVDQGMSHRQIVERVERETGERVTPSAVAVALSRAGLTNPVRYNDTVPWEGMDPKHANSVHLWMLRVAHRVRHGGRVRPSEQERFEHWERKMKEADAVIAYIPESEHGFYPVKRRPGDWEFVRPPADVQSKHHAS